MFGVAQKVGSSRRGWGRVIEKQTKTTVSEGWGVPSMCVCLTFFKKMLRFPKWSFIYSPVFPNDYNGSITYHLFSPVNEWRAIAFTGPHKISNVGYVKGIYFLRQTLFGTPSGNFVFETWFKMDMGTKKPISQ